MNGNNRKPQLGVSRETGNSLSTLLDPIAKAIGKEALAADAPAATRREIMNRTLPVSAAAKAARGSAMPADVAQALFPEAARRV